MKTKTAKQPKQSKPTVQVKDMKPKKDAKGGLRTAANSVIDIDCGSMSAKVGKEHVG